MTLSKLTPSSDFEQPDEIAKAMHWFIEHPQETKAMGARARTAFIERHNWDAEFDRLVAAMAMQSENHQRRGTP